MVTGPRLKRDKINQLLQNAPRIFLRPVNLCKVKYFLPPFPPPHLNLLPSSLAPSGMRCNLHKYLSRRSPSPSGIQSINSQFSTFVLVLGVPHSQLSKQNICYSTPGPECPCTNIKSVSSGEHRERRHRRHLSHTIAQLGPRCLPGCLVASLKKAPSRVATVCKEANKMVTMPSSRITSRYAVFTFFPTRFAGKRSADIDQLTHATAAPGSGPREPAFCMTRY